MSDAPHDTYIRKSDADLAALRTLVNTHIREESEYREQESEWKAKVMEGLDALLLEKAQRDAQSETLERAMRFIKFVAWVATIGMGLWGWIYAQLHALGGPK